MDFLNLHFEHKISKHQWPVLRDMYRINWPRHILSFYTLKTYIEWIVQNPRLDIAIYTSDDDWRKHGTYVLVEYCGPRCNVLFNTLNPEKNEKLLLSTFECLPIERPLTLAAFMDEVRSIAEYFLSSRELITESVCDTLLYYMPFKESLQLQVNDMPNFEFKKLSLENSTLIDDLWPHHYPGSDIFIRNLIQYNLTIGAFHKRTGKLCGWVMQEQIGTIGLLQVEDPYKRQGIGEQLVIRMAIVLANAGIDAIATIMATNRPSRQCFHKIGFKIIGKVSWHDITPSKRQENRDSFLKAKLRKINTCEPNLEKC